MTGGANPGGTRTQSSIDAAPRRALIAGELERILSSRVFGRSPRHRAFLRHIVDATLNGEYARLKESTIALEVFQRDAAHFDSATHSIVRVEAGRLRQKLERFYADEGARSPVAIELTSGNYRPRFVDRIAGGVEPVAMSLAGRAALPPDLPAEALAPYERAWYMMRLRTLEGYRKALALFEEALCRRPDFAAAQRAVGWVRLNIAGHLGVPPDAAAQGPAMAEAIARAEAIEPGHPELDSLRGAHLARFGYDLKAARRHYENSLSRDPQAWGARSSFAWLLIFEGNFLRAQQMFDDEFAHDPFAFFMRHNLGALAYFQRDYARAERIFDEALEMEPGHLIVRIARASVLMASGGAKAAVEELTQCCAMAGDLGGLELERIRALATARRHDEARLALARFDARFAGRHFSAVYRAATHVALGDRDEALHWLERAATERDYWLLNMLVDPVFDPLRDEPAFARTLRGAGLCPLARAG